MTLMATYSPDDNKLRLYASTRLDADTYARVRAAGFIWAPKQDLFVAPAWTPDREDLLLDLCGEIGDDDRSLVDRAEDRAERFEDYSDARRQDADRAHAAVAAIADGIPMGQPILVGHHSERHARKDAERIENGMRRAVKMWETSKYWQARAAGALAHAKYKERPDVRHRRIKGIEADKRKQEATKAHAAKYLSAFDLVDRDSAWKVRDDGSTLTRQERARYIAGKLSGGPYVATVQLDGPNATTLRYTAYDVLAADGDRYRDCPAMSVDQVVDKIRDWVERTNAHADRWIAHFDHRLEYERAMLAEAGGLITDRTEFPIVPGGRVLVGREWLTVTKVNRKDGRIVSVSTNARYVRVKGIEEVQDYQPPTEEAKAAIAARTLPPLLNLDTPDAIRMTQAEYKQRASWGSCGTRVAAATDEHGAYRYRSGFRRDGSHTSAPVFLTDAKAHTQLPAAIGPRPTLPPPEPALSIEEQAARLQQANERRAAEAAEAAPFDALREAMKSGVQVVSAPQLFPTRADIAQQVIDLARIEPGMCVLEPSAGTGALIAPIVASVDTEVLAYEINPALCAQLRQKFPSYRVQVRQADFLTVVDFLGQYPRVVMNPPFANGADIKHIRHAQRMLRPDGRLVAICANGPRQRAAFEDEAEEWIDLPAGSFDGTDVRAAIIVLGARDGE